MRRLLLIPVLLLAALAGPAQARVFESLGRASFQPGGDHPGWARAYAADWALNGAATKVEVWSASETLPAAIARMREEARRQGVIGVFLPGETLAWGAVSGGGRITRCLCTTSDSGRQTTVFLFSQADEDFRQTLGAPRPVALPDSIPAPPGATVLLSAANRDSGSTFAVFSAPGTAADSRQFLAGSLAAAGWKAAAGAGADPAGPMALYLKGAALCGFTAKMSGHDGSCVVTVMHRRLMAGD